MKVYEFIFYLLGYTLFQKQIEEIGLPVEVELNNGKIIPKIRLLKDSHQELNKFKYIIKLIYNIVIFSLITWIIIYAIILTTQTAQTEYILGFVFQLIFSTQYLFGVKYFWSDHLFKKLYENRKLEKKFNKSMIVVLILTIIISLLSVIFVSSGVDVGTNFVLNKLKQVPYIVVLFFVSNFFGYLTFLTNACVFVTIIRDHSSELKDYTDGIQEYMSSSISVSDKVSRISMEVIDLRHRFNESVDKLNLSFSSLSVLGIIDVFFAINFWKIGKITSINIINVITFFIIEYFYIISAQKLRASINTISLSINLPVYINNYLQKNTFGRKIPRISQYDEKEMFESVIHTQISVIEIIEQQSLQQLQTIINGEWESFEIFGIKITDTSLIQKILGLFITIFIAGNLSDASIFQN